MAIKNFLIAIFVMGCFSSMAKSIMVKNQLELAKANEHAQPGDTIILKNGTWMNVALTLNCKGTAKLPIIFKAQTAGNVVISGQSSLKIGGDYLEIRGLYFANGFAGNTAVISFKTNKNEVSNNCRITDIVINDFNNTERLNQNYWIELYGKRNRVDHCSFINKKNLGVLLAVILEDEKSRENFHQIDANYFGVRLPLASNTGEIIRVGVSDHCQYNSNTSILNNYFDNCDGEAEIISIKSCLNIIRNNYFNECQGSVVLRHGNFNTVENNVFNGNGKKGTGGVRVINKGQLVINNLFYKCRGEGFRSPLALMNGIPNSPANRYLEVSDAVICNNTFLDCAPLSFCEGADSERSIPPHNVCFFNNILCNSKDSLAYFSYDNVERILMKGNLISPSIKQNLPFGFSATHFSFQKIGKFNLPFNPKKIVVPITDSLRNATTGRCLTALSGRAGIADMQKIQSIIKAALQSIGANWWSKHNEIVQPMTLNCANADELLQTLLLAKERKITINLTGDEYQLKKSIEITKNVHITSKGQQTIRFSLADSNAGCFFLLKAGNALKLSNLSLQLSDVSSKAFIITDTSGSCEHSSLECLNVNIINLQQSFFVASKTSLLDSFIVSNCYFNQNKGTLFSFIRETDNLGYYNVETIKIMNCLFKANTGSIIGLVRSGKDESTMGPNFQFLNNRIENCTTLFNEPLVSLNGTQFSIIGNNLFINSNLGNDLITYIDRVRAVHFFENNVLTNSGKVITNGYVKFERNVIQ